MSPSYPGFMGPNLPDPVRSVVVVPIICYVGGFFVLVASPDSIRSSCEGMPERSRIGISFSNELKSLLNVIIGEV